VFESEIKNGDHALNGDESDKKEEVVEPMEIAEDPVESYKPPKSVTGVVFQFDENSILFEFSLSTGNENDLDEQDLIGEISPQKLVCNGKKIPADTKGDEISKYVQSGDEIKCQVTPKDDLKVFSFIEEEEEIGEDGEVKRSTRTVEIKPTWSALSGQLLKSLPPIESDSLAQEDILVLQDQLEDMFDYEPDEKDEDEDDDEIILIEEVKFDENSAIKHVFKLILKDKNVLLCQ
jgi:hypothetical protein